MRIVTFLPLAALPLLAACVAPAPVADPLVACAASVNAPGTYEYEDTTGIPVLYPVEDGTQEGADALNVCIAARMGGGTIVSDGPFGIEQRREIIDNGDGTRTVNDTYGTPPGNARGVAVDPQPVGAVPSRSGTCPPGAPTLYGGTSYCIRAR